MENLRGVTKLLPSHPYQVKLWYASGCIKKGRGGEGKGGEGCGGGAAAAEGTIAE